MVHPAPSAELPHVICPALLTLPRYYPKKDWH
jgi:hypothetical protein